MEDVSYRLLEELFEDVVTDSPTVSPTLVTERVSPNDAQILKDSLRVYGSLFLFMITLFCILRKRYPKLYNLRSWVEDFSTELAEDQFGWISWIWKLYLMPDTEILDECGMDALCYGRILEFGLRLAIVGSLNAMWLIPVYATAESSPETDYITDPIVSISVSNLPSGSYRFVATVVSSYVIFGYTMYNILQEFHWFIANRHQFLSKKLPRNYSVYVRNIPIEYRSSRRLQAFFEQGFRDGVVLEAHLAVRVPVLKKKVTRREKIVDQLSRVLYLEDVMGVTPKRRTLTDLTGSNHQKLSDSLYQELAALNKSITQSIEAIEKRQLSPNVTNLHDSSFMEETFPMLAAPPSNDDVQLDHDQLESNALSNTTATNHIKSSKVLLTGVSEFNTPVPDVTYHTEPESLSKGDDGYSGILAITTNTVSSIVRKSFHLAGSITSKGTQLASEFAPEPILTGAKLATEKYKQGAKLATKGAKHGAKLATKGAKQGAKIATQGAKLATQGAKLAAEPVVKGAKLASQPVLELANQALLLVSPEDGVPMSAGFVTFKSLRSSQAALQIIQCPEPFVMEVLEAPQPEDVFWFNVGKSHQELQIGKLLSFSLTTALCLFWTIPMSTVASLASIEGLKAQVPWINELVEKAPWLEPILAQLAPLLLVLMDEVLKVVLEALSALEGPISGAVIEASLFSKFATFMIIQTFFVSALSGSVLSQLSNIIQEPGEVVPLLANSLPAQSTFFIQIILVDTFVVMGVELLGVARLASAGVRRFVGPRLTEKERNSRFMGLQALCDPFDFEHAKYLSSTVLHFMVYFVYAAIAPITNVFLVLGFFFLGAGYRHQFVYINNPFPDSGGKLWSAFFGILPICMIIAELTIVGLLALKQTPIASALMFPLLVITILFYIYIKQKHYAMASFLPARDCMAVDLKNNAEREMDYQFLREKYRQPELREKELLPQNSTVEREIAQGCVEFFDPMSETGVGSTNV